MAQSNLEQAVEIVTNPAIGSVDMFKELGKVLTRHEDLEHAVYTIEDDAKAADKVKYVAFIASYIFKAVSKLSKLSLPTKIGAQAGAVASDILTVTSQAFSAYKNEPAEKMEEILKNLDAKVYADFKGHLTDKKGKYNVDLAEIYLTYYAMFNIFTLFLMLYFAMAGKSVDKIQQKQAQEIFHAFRKFSNKFKKNTGTETAQDLNLFSPAESDSDMIDQEAIDSSYKRIRKEQEAKLKELQKDLKEKQAAAQKIDHQADYEGINKEEAQYLDATSQQLTEQQRQVGQWNKETVTGNDYAAGGYQSPEEQQDKLKELMDNMAHQMKQRPSADNSKNETPAQQVAKRARKMLQEDEKRLSDLRRQKIAEAKAAREKQQKKEMREVNKKLKNELKALKEQEKIYANNDITDDRSYWSNGKPESENIPTTHDLQNKLRKTAERAKAERIHNELIEKRKKAAALKQKQEAEPKAKQNKKSLKAEQKQKAKPAKKKAKMYKGINRQKKSRPKAKRVKFRHALNHDQAVYLSKSGIKFYGISRKVYNKKDKKRRWNLVCFLIHTVKIFIKFLLKILLKSSSPRSKKNLMTTWRRRQFMTLFVIMYSIITKLTG